MYIWTSEFVKPDLKKKIKLYASAMRWLVKLEQEERNNGFLAGLRFHDDEQVFQSFCQKFFKNESEASVADIDSDALPEMVEQALINAGKCDYVLRLR